MRILHVEVIFGYNIQFPVTIYSLPFAYSNLIVIRFKYILVCLVINLCAM